MNVNLRILIVNSELLPRSAPPKPMPSSVNYDNYVNPYLFSNNM